MNISRYGRHWKLGAGVLTIAAASTVGCGGGSGSGSDNTSQAGNTAVGGNNTATGGSSAKSTTGGAAVTDTTSGGNSASNGGGTSVAGTSTIGGTGADGGSSTAGGASSTGGMATVGGSSATGGSSTAGGATSVSPLSITGDLSFGAVNCGATAQSKTLSLTNNTAGTIHVSAAFSAGSASPYRIPATSNVAIAAGSTLQLTVTPAAIPSNSSVPGNYDDMLVITTDISGDSAHTLQATESAQGAVLQFNPTTLDFGSISTNTSTNASFQVLNIGNAPAHVTVSTDNAAFTVAPATAAIISATQPGSFVGTFTPEANTTTQQANASIAVAADDVLCAPLPAPLTMTGAGQSGPVSYSPGALNFGNVDCGTTAQPQTVTFSNPGTADYHITAATLTANRWYTVTTSAALPLLVPKGGTATITVTPNAIPAQSAVTANLYGDTLTVTTDATGDNPHTIQLSETAQGGIIAISQQNLNFGSAIVGASASYQYSISNSGNSAVSVAYTGLSFPNVFFMPSQTIAGGSVATSTALFTPSVAQTYADTATLNVTGVLCQPLPFTTSQLAGVGSIGVLVKVSPTSLVFGDKGLVPCGTSAAAQAVTVTNDASQPITVTASLGLGSSSPYTYAISNGGNAAAGGGTVTITVTPMAVPTTSSTAADGLADTLTITTTAPNDQPHVVQLHETAEGAIFSFSRQTINFPTTRVGQLTTVGGNFQVLNSGNVSANFTLNSSDATDFSIAPSLSGTATSSKPAAFAGIFEPASTGSKTTTVTITPASDVVLCAPVPDGMTMSGTAR